MDSELIQIIELVDKMIKRMIKTVFLIFKNIKKYFNVET